MVKDLEKLLALAQSQGSVNEEQAAFLRRLRLQYPFFQLPFYLYLRHLKQTNDFDFDDFLSLTASLTVDRAYLYDKLHNLAPEVKIYREEENDAVENFEGDKKQETVQENFELSRGLTTDRMSYLDWIRFYSNSGQPQQEILRKKDKKQMLIDKFLDEQPKIKPAKNYTPAPLPEVVESVKEKTDLMTETLANLYLKQGKYKKALQAFEILKLKYPEKNRYFAIRIDEVKSLMKDKK